MGTIGTGSSRASSGKTKSSSKWEILEDLQCGSQSWWNCEQPLVEDFVNIFRKYLFLSSQSVSTDTKMWCCKISSQTHLLPGNLDLHTKKNVDHNMSLFTTQSAELIFLDAKIHKVAWTFKLCIYCHPHQEQIPLKFMNRWSLLKGKTSSIVLYILASATPQWNLYTSLFTGPT